MDLNIETTTKICCNLIVDFNAHMMVSIPDIRTSFPEKTDKEILYKLLERTMEVFEQNRSSLWN